jgi:biotin carboxylase
MIQVLAVAHFCKGKRMLATFRELGCRIVLLSRADRQHENWPRHLVDEVFFVKDFRDRRDVLNAVSYLNQDRHFDLVAPLDEYAVSTAAKLRAHLACPGMCEGTTRKVRDKLTMRCIARDHGIPVPRYSGFNNKADIGELLHSTPAPWMVKPRSAGGAVQIRKLWTEDEVWQLYHELEDRRSHHLIEEFVPSDVCHVDTVVSNGEIVLEVAGQYANPPFDVWHGGGVFAAATVDRGSKRFQQLSQMNADVIRAMGIKNGVNHAEFLCRGGDVFFLEIAARVPGSNLDQLATASTGIDLFAEAARIQYFSVIGEDYKIPDFEYTEAGLVQCLAKDKHPSLGAVGSLPEVYWTLDKEYHAGVSFSAPDSQRIEQLMTQTLEQFGTEHLAVLPASDSPA